MIEGVIFDMDGLMVDSEPLWREAEIAVFAELGVTLTEADCRRTKGWRTNEVIAYWHGLRPWPGPSVAEVETTLLDRMVDLLSHRSEALPGLMATLNFFTELNVPMAVASSSPRRLIDAVVDHLQVRDRFRALVSAEKEPYGKPHPAVFLNTADQLGVDPTRCLVFEDSLAGLIAAKAARMRAIAVPEASERRRPGFAIADRVLRSLNEFSLAIWLEMGGAPVS